MVRFLHYEAKLAAAGGRRGVDASDLRTGNAAHGKQYFFGAGGCGACHSPTGDLAAIALRYSVLDLERQMLYPRNAKRRVTVTSGKDTIKGVRVYLDEFTVALRDQNGGYRSWPTRKVTYWIDRRTYSAAGKVYGHQYSRSDGIPADTQVGALSAARRQSCEVGLSDH